MSIRPSRLASSIAALLVLLPLAGRAAPGGPDASPIALGELRGFRATYDVTLPTPEGDRTSVWEVEQRPDVRHGVEVWRRIIRQPGAEPVIDVVYLEREDGGFVAKEVRSPGGIDHVEAWGDSLRHVHLDPVREGTDPVTSWIPTGGRVFDAGSWDVLAIGFLGPGGNGQVGSDAGGAPGEPGTSPTSLAAALVDPVPGLGTAIPLELTAGRVERVSLPTGETLDARTVTVASAYFQATVWVIAEPPYVVRAEMGGHQRVLREVRVLEEAP